MPGYLDQYGAGEERREKILKTVAVAVVLIIVLGGVLFFVFHNWREERQAKRFFELLARADYQGAYALWGCTDAHPCRDYPMTDFMRDWGPGSGRGTATDFRITRSRSCGSGVILTVQTSTGQEKLWVQKSDLTLGFSPYPGCPPGR